MSSLAAFLLLLSACVSGFPTEPVDDDDATDPQIVFDDDDDDSSDDDDAAPDDDDAAPDDDDAAPDDDDAAPDDDDTGEFEGDQPGECSDGADNDQDGLFDCDDPNCFGAPNCQGDDDDAAPDDDDTAPDDDDTAPDDDDAVDTFEGDEPGECEDGIDNDGDFLTDCADPTCNLDPACGGGDDDDATAPPDGSPLITSVSGTWNASSAEFEFDIVAVDADCDVGQPILGWTFNSSPQSPVPLGTDPMACTTNITFWVQVSPGPTYQFTFTVTDAAGHTSAAWPITVTAS